MALVPALKGLWSGVNGYEKAMMVVALIYSGVIFSPGLLVSQSPFHLFTPLLFAGRCWAVTGLCLFQRQARAGFYRLFVGEYMGNMQTIKRNVVLLPTPIALGSTLTILCWLPYLVRLYLLVSFLILELPLGIVPFPLWRLFYQPSWLAPVLVLCLLLRWCY